jgi:serine/threonine protein kinase
MSGGDLFDRIVAKKFYEENDARNASKRLLEAVAYCHSRHIVHRDLKPDNLLLSRSDNDMDIKLGDFGLATEVSSNDSLEEKCGTLNYTAPEILMGHRYGTLQLCNMIVIF